MKKVGKEVLFLDTDKNNLRNGESTMIRLKDNRIMFLYTQFYGKTSDDDSTARLCASYSSDEGETWSIPKVIISKPETAQNIMSPSLFRLPDGGLGVIYLRKDIQEDNNISCMPVFSRSDDEGESWSEAIDCGMPVGYYCVVNDCALVSKSGRIYMPMSYYGSHYGVQPGEIHIAYSDDCGKSWHESDRSFHSPFCDSFGLAEPGIFEHENGDMWIYMRTPYGHQYQTFSFDHGKTWMPIVPNFRFTSPDSPMRVKRIGKYVIAAYNPVSFNCLRTDTELWGSPKRTPIVISVSKDDGKSFTDRTKVFADGGYKDIIENTYLLEDDTTNSYCYPSLIETNDGFLVSYYHSNNSKLCLNASKINKVYYSELI